MDEISWSGSSCNYVVQNDTTLNHNFPCTPKLELLLHEISDALKFGGGVGYPLNVKSCEGVAAVSWQNSSD